MKKSLIALAVAGAMTAPMIAQADATLYGSFRIGVESVEDADLNVEDQSSRIGIKGDIDLGLEGTKGLFHWEANVSTADSNEYGGGQMFGQRLGYIGAKGDWGQVLIGRQYHPHYLLISAPTNLFNPGSGNWGERFNLGNDQHKRVDNTIAYYTPKMNGFQAIAGFVLQSDGSDSDVDGALDDDVDGYNVAGTYSANNVTVSASYGHVEASDTVEVDTWGLSAKYKLDALELMLKYEDQETEIGTANDQEEDVWELGARYTMGATSVYARYADYDTENNFELVDGQVVDADYQQWGIGVTQKLGKGRVFLEHVKNDSDDVVAGDRTTAGYRVDF
ncbi:porin [Neptuniibacter sp. QD57_21]|uniref:porin n=1 Tax=Neptuniibacter sp. QD57_21 TaxID=3398213 RepID=UPI0039F4AD5E